MLKRLLLLLGWASVVMAYQSTTSNCNSNGIFQAVAVAPPTTATYNNRLTRCTNLRLSYYAEGFSGVSVHLQGAPDNNGVPGSWADIGSTYVTQGTNPSTDIHSATIFVGGGIYYPWIGVSVSTATGTGSISWQLYGTYGVSAASGGGGLNQLTGDVIAGPGTGSVSATVDGLQGNAVCSTSPTSSQVLTWSGTAWCPATPGAGGINQLTGDGTAGPGTGSQALTLASVNSGSGVCGDASHVCVVTTNAKGLVTAQSTAAVVGGVSSVFGQTGAVDIPITTTDISSTSLPSSGNTKAYSRAGKWCSLDPSGNETCMGQTTGGGAFLSGPGNPGFPIPVFIQGNGAAAGNPSVVSYSSNVSSGNLSVVSIGCQTGTLTLTVTDTRSTVYTKIADASNGTGYSAVYSGVLSSSGADTVTASGGSCSNGGITVQEFSGTTNTIDVSSVNTSASTGPAAITTIASGDLLELMSYTPGAACVAIAPTILDFNTGTTCSGHIVANVAGTYTPSLNPSRGSNAFTIAYKGTAIASPGNNGDFYLNTTSGILFGPKTGGTWGTTGLSLLNSTGANGQTYLSGTPILGACGSSPTLSSGSVNNYGTINVGSGTVTSCILNFSPPFTRTPTCVITDDSTAFSSDISSVSTASITFSFSSSIGSGHIYYHCN